MSEVFTWAGFYMDRHMYFAAAVVAYLCGCFNGAVIVSKYILRNDVRKHGSGNAGLTNFYRTFGGALTAVVILCDVLKAVVALRTGVWIAGFSKALWVNDGYHLWITLFKYWSALFCLLGHMFPCMFKFKGGKGVLSGGAIVLMIDWRIALVVWAGFIILFLLTRYVSLGSLWAGISFPFATWFCYRDPTIIVLGFLCGGLIIWQHRSNIKRLIQGNENKFSFHRKS